MGLRGQEPNESTDDAVWQDLVARLEGTPADPVSDAPGRGTSASGGPDGPGLGTPPGEGEPSTDPLRRGDDAGPSARERADAIFRDQPLRQGPRDHALEEPDDDEGFVPEEPPPLGSGDPLLILAWIGAAGGPITLLLFAMFWRDAPLAATLGLLALFLGGAGYLVTRLPQHRDIGDDGAEV